MHFADVNRKPVRDTYLKKVKKQFCYEFDFI